MSVVFQPAFNEPMPCPTRRIQPRITNDSPGFTSMYCRNAPLSIPDISADPPLVLLWLVFWSIANSPAEPHACQVVHFVTLSLVRSAEFAGIEKSPFSTKLVFNFPAFSKAAICFLFFSISVSLKRGRFAFNCCILTANGTSSCARFFTIYEGSWIVYFLSPWVTWISPLIWSDKSTFAQKSSLNGAWSLPVITFTLSKVMLPRVGDLTRWSVRIVMGVRESAVGVDRLKSMVQFLNV